MTRANNWALASAKANLPALTQRERTARFSYQRQAMRTLAQTYEDLLLLHSGLRETPETPYEQTNVTGAVQ